jgi:membrane dipeptidase
VLGVALHIGMLRWGGNGDAPQRRDVGLEQVALHIDHICQLAGDAKHAAIGSDLDGGFGREQSPSDLDTIADLQHLAEILSRRGYSDADIAAIMHANWIRVLRRAWNQ